MTPETNGAGQWPLWEVFTQPPGGKPHEHAGSVHAPDAEVAMQNARAAPRFSCPTGFPAAPAP